ncbi:helix-turn-helix domain-containing protein [Embleya sp. NBC_00888]|uniref:helix-turn-helix domain-containing protein n=1 Tax=Embleya sp. NBC_00888 TaxID=2975960 RepID=UPI0038646F20|nr:helix-turn-helix domain-containing protein [Embleya sp. NBC_00888]
MRFKPRPIDPGAGPRGTYGELMREYREAAGLSLEIVAGKLGYDTSTLSRFERAQRSIPSDIPAKLDELFATGLMFQSMYRMIKDDRHPGRWRLLSDYEAKAVRIGTYAPQVVPGLLQTPEYARALLLNGEVYETAEEIDDATNERIARQSTLARDDPPAYSAVLDEAVLHRMIGSHETTHQQLASLLPQVDTSRTTIQVWPSKLGGHPLLGGTTVLMTLADGTTGVWLEGSDSGQLIEDPDEVRRRQRAYDRVCARAPSPKDSAEMIKAAIEEFRT